jgi:hypothetical protein
VSHTSASPAASFASTLCQTNVSFLHSNTFKELPEFKETIGKSERKIKEQGTETFSPSVVWGKRLEIGVPFLPAFLAEVLCHKVSFGSCYLIP